jgi:hypothetical protein
MRPGPRNRRRLDPLHPKLQCLTAIADVTAETKMRYPASTCLGIDPCRCDAQPGSHLLGREKATIARTRIEEISLRRKRLMDHRAAQPSRTGASPACGSIYRNVSTPDESVV